MLVLSVSWPLYDACSLRSDVVPISFADRIPLPRSLTRKQAPQVCLIVVTYLPHDVPSSTSLPHEDLVVVVALVVPSVVVPPSVTIDWNSEERA